MDNKQNFSNAINKLKIQNVIAKLKQSATFHAGHWSSAQYFENDLKRLGIVPPIEIYHPYKMPNGYTEKSYEDYIMWLFDLMTFDKNKILNIKEYVKKVTDGTPMTEPEIQNYTNILNEPIKDLTDAEKQQIVDMLLQEKSSVQQNLLKQIDIIKQLNPELKNIPVAHNSQSIFDFLIGVTSAFHPDDIKHFMSVKDINQERSEQDKFRKTIGMDTYSLFLEPNRMQLIIRAVQEHNKMLAISRDNRMN